MSTFGFMKRQSRRRFDFLRLALLALYLLVTLGSQAQSSLNLLNRARFKRYRIYPGETLGVRLAGDRYWRTVTLEALRADTVVLMQEVSGTRVRLPVSDITAVRYTRDTEPARVRRLASTALALGGAMTLGLRALNSQGQGVVYLQGTGFWVPAAAVGLGLFWRLSEKQRFNVGPGRRWQLNVLDTEGLGGGRR